MTSSYHHHHQRRHHPHNHIRDSDDGRELAIIPSEKSESQRRFRIIRDDQRPWFFAKKYRGWYEWVTAFIIVILLMDSMYELISTSILLGSYKNRRKLSDAWPEVYYAFPDYSFLCMLLVAQILLILTVGGSGIWLKFHRNPYEFILLCYLIVFDILFHITAIVLAIYLYLCADTDSIKKEIFQFVKENVHNSNYQLVFTSFQLNIHCCGIFDYKDWNKFNLGSKLNTSFVYIHQSCSKFHEPHERNPNKHELIVLNDVAIEREKLGIFSKGCGDSLIDKYYYPLYIPYIAEGVIAIFLTIILLYLITLLYHIISYEIEEEEAEEEIIEINPIEDEQEQEHSLEIEYSSRSPGKFSHIRKSGTEPNLPPAIETLYESNDFTEGLRNSRVEFPSRNSMKKSRPHIPRSHEIPKLHVNTHHHPNKDAILEIEEKEILNNEVHGGKVVGEIKVEHKFDKDGKPIHEEGQKKLATLMIVRNKHAKDPPPNISPGHHGQTGHLAEDIVEMSGNKKAKGLIDDVIIPEFDTKHNHRQHGHIDEDDEDEEEEAERKHNFGSVTGSKAELDIERLISPTKLRKEAEKRKKKEEKEFGIIKPHYLGEHHRERSLSRSHGRLPHHHEHEHGHESYLSPPGHHHRHSHEHQIENEEVHLENELHHLEHELRHVEEEEQEEHRHHHHPHHYLGEHNHHPPVESEEIHLENELHHLEHELHHIEEEEQQEERHHHHKTEPKHHHHDY